MFVAYSPVHNFDYSLLLRKVATWDLRVQLLMLHPPRPAPMLCNSRWWIKRRDASNWSTVRPVLLGAICQATPEQILSLHMAAAYLSFPNAQVALHLVVLLSPKDVRQKVLPNLPRVSIRFISYELPVGLLLATARYCLFHHIGKAGSWTWWGIFAV